MTRDSLHGNFEQPRRHSVKMCSCEERGGTRHCGQDRRDIVESIRVRHEGSPGDDEI